MIVCTSICPNDCVYIKLSQSLCAHPAAWIALCIAGSSNVVVSMKSCNNEYLFININIINNFNNIFNWYVYIKLSQWLCVHEAILMAVYIPLFPNGYAHIMLSQGVCVNQAAPVFCVLIKLSKCVVLTSSRPIVHHWVYQFVQMAVCLYRGLNCSVNTNMILWLCVH